MRISLTWILVGSLMGFPAAAAAAADSQIERASLTGLTTISVVVEELAPIAEKNGLTTASARPASPSRRMPTPICTSTSRSRIRERRSPCRTSSTSR